MPIVHLKNSAGVITEYTGTVPFPITGLPAGVYEFTEGLTKRNVTVTAPSGGGTPTPTNPTFTGGTPLIQSDGTPQVGETLTGVATVNNGTVTAHAWLANGAVLNGATSSTYTPSTTGSYQYRATATGATGSTPATATSAAVTVTEASAGTPTLNALTVSPNSTTVGTAYSGSVAGKSADTALSLAGAGSPGLSVVGTAISGTPTTAGAVDVVETPTTGSPRTSSGVLTVAAAPVTQPMPTAANYFAAMTTQPDATRKGQIEALFSGLQTDGVLDKLAWLGLLASHDQQSALLNAANPAKSALLVNNPIFTANLGIAGGAAGTNGYINFNEEYPASGHFTQNSATAGAWCNLMGDGTGLQPHMGKQNSASPSVIVRAHGTAGSGETYTCNDGSTNSTARTSTGDRRGHRTSSRIVSSEKRAFFNGAKTATNAAASTGVAAGLASALRHDALYTTDRLAVVYYGAGLTDDQVLALHNRLNTYLTAIGAA